MTMLEVESSRDIAPIWFDLMSSVLMNASQGTSNGVSKVLEHFCFRNVPKFSVYKDGK